MITVNEQTVLRTVREVGPASLTAISKEMGFASSNDRVKEMLANLVDEGAIDREMSSGLIIYSIAAAPSTSESSFENPVIPQNNFGYTIEASTRNGVEGYLVSDNDSVDPKTKFLTKDQRLVVINQSREYRFVINRPEELLKVLSAVNDGYCSSNNIYSYTVKSVHTNSTVTDMNNPIGQISTEPVVIFLEVVPENKAG